MKSPSVQTGLRGWIMSPANLFIRTCHRVARLHADDVDGADSGTCGGASSMSNEPPTPRAPSRGAVRTPRRAIPAPHVETNDFERSGAGRAPREAPFFGRLTFRTGFAFGNIVSSNWLPLSIFAPSMKNAVRGSASGGAAVLAATAAGHLAGHQRELVEGLPARSLGAVEERDAREGARLLDALELHLDQVVREDRQLVDLHHVVLERLLVVVEDLVVGGVLHPHLVLQLVELDAHWPRVAVLVRVDVVRGVDVQRDDLHVARLGRLDGRGRRTCRAERSERGERQGEGGEPRGAGSAKHAGRPWRVSCSTPVARVWGKFPMRGPVVFAYHRED
jgi:hypothetical protein